MVTEQAQASRTRARSRALPQRFPDRVAQIILIARTWDRESPSRLGIPAPRAGWAATFTDAAERGFLRRGDIALSD